MAFTDYVKRRILALNREGMRPPTITRVLCTEGLRASRRGILFLTRYEMTESLARQPGSGRKTIITEEIRTIVEGQMQADDTSTATQLHQLLIHHGHNVSLRTVLRCRTALGWTFSGSAYCQPIRTANKAARLKWARDHVGEAEGGFEDVIWTDECTIAYRWNIIDDFAPENRASHQKTSHGQSIQLKFTFGLESASGELHRPVFLMELWMQTYILKFCSKTYSHSFKLCIPYHIDSCKIMTRSIHRKKHGNSSHRTQSTGGRLRQNRQTATP